MRLRSPRYSLRHEKRLKMHLRLSHFFALLTLALIAASCQYVEQAPPVKTEIIEVRIPPFYDPGLTYGENQCIFSDFLFPEEFLQNVVKSCKGSGAVNDDSLLHLSLEKDGSFLLNGQSTVNEKPIGSLDNTDSLQAVLVELFQERENQRAFEPRSKRIVKAVGVKIPLDSRSSDLITTLRAVKKSGADPIILLIDGHLPYQPLSVEAEIL